MLSMSTGFGLGILATSLSLGLSLIRVATVLGVHSCRHITHTVHALVKTTPCLSLRLQQEPCSHSKTYKAKTKQSPLNL